MAVQISKSLHFIPPHRRGKLTNMAQVPEGSHREGDDPSLTLDHEATVRNVLPPKADSHHPDPRQSSQHAVAQLGDTRPEVLLPDDFQSGNTQPAHIQLKHAQNEDSQPEEPRHESLRSSASDCQQAARQTLPIIDAKVDQASGGQDNLIKSTVPSSVEPHHASAPEGGVLLKASRSLAPHHIRRFQRAATSSANAAHFSAHVSELKHAVKESSGIAAKTKFQPKMVLPTRKGKGVWIKDSDLRKQEQQRQDDTYLATQAGWAMGWGDTNTDVQEGVALPKDSGYSLVNYDGSWAPPPEDWHSRPPFRDHQAAESIRNWLACIEIDQVPLRYVFRVPTSTNFYQSIPDASESLKRHYFAAPINSIAIMGDIIPQSTWRPEQIEGYSSLKDFWDAFQHMPPETYDVDDLIGAKPWWETSLSSMACFLVPPEQPEHKGVNVTDQSKEEIRKLEGDRGSNHFIERWTGGWRPHHDQFKGKGKSRAIPAPILTKVPPEKETRVQEEEAFDGYIPDLSIKPEVNLYIRRVHISDVAQITEIYNHFATNTCCVPECAPITSSRMADRLRSIKAVSHSFIVACLSTGPSLKGVGRGPGRRNSPRSPPTVDRIIGFAYSDDFNDSSSMYRFIAEIEIYTHPGYTRKGVASCLLDKLVAILDPYWICRGGYEVRDDEIGETTRNVSGLWINFPYVPEAEEKQWVGKWLESCGFEQTGDHKQVAFKVGKWYVFFDTKRYPVLLFSLSQLDRFSLVYAS